MAAGGMLGGSTNQIINIKFITSGLEKVRKGMQNANAEARKVNKRIQEQSGFSARQAKDYTTTRNKIDAFSQSIQRNNNWIKEQQGYQKQGLKGANQTISALRSRNEEYKEGRLVAQSNLAGTRKEMQVTRKNAAITRGVTAANENSEIAQQGFFKTMKMGQARLGQFNKEQRRFTNMGGKMANGIRMATHGIRGFKMEMLGVMFFGMALQRVFAGLIKTSLEWMGVTEIFSMTLGVLFLPVAELVLGWALAFLDWVLKLTEGEKKLIGFFVMLGIAIGSALFVIGTLALGIGSLILAFGWLLSPIGLVIAGLAALAGFVLFKALFSDTSKGVDKLRGSLVKMGISGEVFDNMANKIKEWYNVVKQYLFGSEEEGKIGFISTIKKNLLKFAKSEEVTLAGKNAMQNFVKGAQTFFANNPMVLMGAIIGGLSAGPMGIGMGAAVGGALGSIDFSKIKEIIEAGLKILKVMVQGIIDNAPVIIEAITEVIDKMIGFIGEYVTPLMDAGLEILTAIIEGINQNKDKIAEIMLKIINTIQTWISDNSGLIIQLGITIGELIGKGLWQALKNSVKSSGAKAFDYMVPGGSSVRGMFKSGAEFVTGNDFVVQPGGRMIKTNPRDYLMATTNPQNLGGGAENINITYYITGVSSPNDVKKMLEENNRKLVSDITRSVKV